MLLNNVDVFSVKKTQAHMRSNPNTREAIKIKASKKVFYGPTDPFKSKSPF